MKIGVLVPVHAFEDGKQRLAPTLSQAERTRLNRCFFLHTLDVLSKRLNPKSCFVVSDSAEVLEITRAKYMVPVLETSKNGMNSALGLAAVSAFENGCEGVLSISCDLPFLAISDIDALVEAINKNTMVIAPDKWGTGTNALFFPNVNCIHYQYGEGSFARHMLTAKKAGLKIVVIKRNGLANDLDTPQDLARWPQNISHNKD